MATGRDTVPPAATKRAAAASTSATYTHSPTGVPAEDYKTLAAAVMYLWQLRPRQAAQLWLMGPLLAIVGLALCTEWLARQLPLDPSVGLVAQLVPALVLVVLGMRLVQQ